MSFFLAAHVGLCHLSTGVLKCVASSLAQLFHWDFRASLRLVVPLAAPVRLAFLAHGEIFAHSLNAFFRFLDVLANLTVSALWLVFSAAEVGARGQVAGDILALLLLQVPLAVGIGRCPAFALLHDQCASLQRW